MGETTDDQPAGGIRASDAERDATVERLSRAAGDGRLTLDEFSQRMEQATAAKTRAELDRLAADLPAEPAVAGALAAPASAPATWHVSPVGGLRVSGPWRMARHVIVASIVGGTWLDLSEAQLAAPEVTLTTVSLVGGTRIMVPPGIRVEASGFSLVGGTRVEGGPEPGPGAPTVHIRAFSLVGGIRIQRSGQPGDRGPRGDWRAEREDRHAGRRDWRAERRAERRSRRGRPGYSCGQARRRLRLTERSSGRPEPTTRLAPQAIDARAHRCSPALPASWPRRPSAAPDEAPWRAC